MRKHIIAPGGRVFVYTLLKVAVMEDYHQVFSRLCNQSCSSQLFSWSSLRSSRDLLVVTLIWKQQQPTPPSSMWKLCYTKYRVDCSSNHVPVVVDYSSSVDELALGVDQRSRQRLAGHFAVGQETGQFTRSLRRENHPNDNGQQTDGTWVGNSSSDWKSIATLF